MKGVVPGDRIGARRKAGGGGGGGFLILSEAFRHCLVFKLRACYFDKININFVKRLRG